MLEVSRSGYYAWRERPASRARQRRAGAGRQDPGRCTTRTAGSTAARGCIRPWRPRARSVCENTVAKIMRERQIRAKTKTQVRAPDHRQRPRPAGGAQPAGPAVRGRRAQPQVGRRTSRTSPPTRAGCTWPGVIDLCSRRIVGWSMADHLRDGAGQRCPGRWPWPAGGPAKGLLHHSDRGVQYASDDYQAPAADPANHRSA